MPQIVISEFMYEPAVERLKARYDTLYDPALVDQPERLADAVAEATVLVVRNRTQVRGGLLEAARRLKCVGRLGVGLDNIDVAACTEREIAVYPATGANDDSVAEYVLAAALLLLRSVWHSSDEVAAGQWPRQKLGQGREIAGRTLGLVGYGAIGMRLGRLAGGVGMSVIAFDPAIPASDARWASAKRMETLGELLGTADVVSLHVPLVPSTRHLIGEAAIRRMKPGAVLINAARGGVVDEAALCRALREGRLGGAALDVFEKEPVDAKSGALFAGCPNLLLTPHIAGVTADSNERVSELIADRVIAHLEGRS